LHNQGKNLSFRLQSLLELSVLVFLSRSWFALKIFIQKFC